MESNIKGKNEETRYERKERIKKQRELMVGRKGTNIMERINKERMNEKAESGFSWLSKDTMVELFFKYDNEHSGSIKVLGYLASCITLSF
jgi:hypothetical protein